MFEVVFSSFFDFKFLSLWYDRFLKIVMIDVKKKLWKMRIFLAFHSSNVTHFNRLTFKFLPCWTIENITIKSFEWKVNFPFYNLPILTFKFFLTIEISFSFTCFQEKNFQTLFSYKKKQEILWIFHSNFLFNLILNFSERR